MNYTKIKRVIIGGFSSIVTSLQLKNLSSFARVRTDVVYLTHAIRSLAATYPKLATINAEGAVHLQVRLYKYRPGTSGVIGLCGGGSSNIARFIHTYKKETGKFGAEGSNTPLSSFTIEILAQRVFAAR